MWPDPTLLRDKLYGNLEELRRTAAFVRATGISILRTTKKKKTESLLYVLVQGKCYPKPAKEMYISLRLVPKEDTLCCHLYQQGN